MSKRKFYLVFSILIFSQILSTKVLKANAQLVTENPIYSLINSGNEISFSAHSAFKFDVKLSDLNPAAELKQKEVSTSTENIKPSQISWLEAFWSYMLIIILLLGIGLVIRWYEKKLHQSSFEAQNLKVLNDAKNKLFSNITHEFRTPLTVIYGMADQIKDNESQKILIQRNARILLRLVNQVLSISKAEMGALKVHMVNDNIVSFIKYLLESFEFVCKSRGINLIFYTEEEKIEMDFDMEKIQLILSNLLSNAINHVSEGGQILIHTHIINEGNAKKFVLKVKDDGTGIEEADIPHVFERYFQASEVNKKVYDGSGIGLALTKELVNLLGGQISVKSKLNVGTEFEVLLPIKMEADQAEIEQSKTYFKHLVDVNELANAGIHHLDNKIGLNTKSPDEEDKPVILLIDDNYDVKYYISSILQDEYKVISADNGKDGISKAIGVVPDIVISDIMMPEKDGFEVCRILKEDFRTSHIPLILLTAKVDKKDLLKGLERGADLYLTKPFNKEELLLRIKNIIEMKKQIQSKLSDQPLNGDSKDNKEMQFIKKFNKLIEENLHEEEMKILYFSRLMGMSRSQLYRKIKALTGDSISVYIRNYRLSKAEQLLRDSNMNVSQVAFEVGFNDLSYFSTKFKEKYGISPSSIQN